MDKTKIDELRGLGCLLVLAYHAIVSEPSLYAGPFGYFASSLQFIRMPIFIAITGLLYGLSRDSQPLNWHGWRKRMQRLLPPFAFLTLVVCALDAIKGGGFHPLDALVFGAWHLWYILALGVILLSVIILKTVISFTSDRFWFAAAVAALLAATGVLAGTQAFGIGRAVALLPFFLVGAAIGSASDQEVSKPLRTLIYAAGLVALIIHQLSLNGIGHKWASGSIVATSMGLAGFLLFGTLCPRSRRLRQIGVHSLPIFLWHLPVYAISSGLILHRLHLDAHLAVALRIALGVVVPICLANLAEVYAPGIALLIGARNRKRRAFDEQRERELAWGGGRSGEIPQFGAASTAVAVAAGLHVPLGSAADVGRD